MKLAIISDTHFGDPDGQLVTRDDALNSFSRGPKYQAFHDALKSRAPLDYLVLNGDIFDLSVAEYRDAYACAQAFFRFVIEDDLVRPSAKGDDRGGGFIYLAGNHDADIWHIMQHERSVINPVATGDLPWPYDHAVPAIIDDRKQSPNQGLTLSGVSPYGGDGYKYGGMFLDGLLNGIAGQIDKYNPAEYRYHFNFAFPNLYIVTDKECVLVTHGQYFEGYWSLLGELVKNIAGVDMDLGSEEIAVCMEDLVAMNYPLNQLACTGIGQAGILTNRLIRPLRREIGSGQYERFSNYVERLKNILIDDVTAGKSSCVRMAGSVIKKIFFKKALLEKVKESQDTRYRTDFLTDPAVRARFDRFFKSSCVEIGNINTSSEFLHCQLPVPSSVIFGHTHQPIGLKDPSPPYRSFMIDTKPVTVKLYNSGGWLQEAGQAFCGAEIFIYESGAGFSSVPIK